MPGFAAEYALPFSGQMVYDTKGNIVWAVDAVLSGRTGRHHAGNLPM